jgi:hypothetical protein
VGPGNLSSKNLLFPLVFAMRSWFRDARTMSPMTRLRFRSGVESRGRGRRRQMQKGMRWLVRVQTSENA